MPIGEQTAATTDKNRTRPVLITTNEGHADVPKRQVEIIP